ncbi:PIR Superfamily Protein [Plasmodium ovale curtisi]|uniref:PIR Superfamily Protein n=1 Tax=Plasmodium ovale curtisi TaxID=864141 RepID=A0A1A8WGW8_PLAOA|nr:PIR Superfamily Protein [Plasmodium ovale curtisi]
MANILTKKDIERLPSIKYYSKFDAFVNFCTEDIDSLKQKLLQYFGGDNVANKIVNALCNTAFINSGNPECTERCEYLFYWIGNKLFSNGINVNLFSQISDVLNSLLEKEGSRSKCKCNFSYPDLSKEKFKDIEVAYFYYKDYEEIQQRLSFYNESCEQDYKIYIDKCSEKYNNVYDTCKGSDEKHCNILKKVVPNFFNTKFSILTCNVADVGAQIEDPQIEEFELDENPGSPALMILICILLPLLGTVFFLLYKFTPFGWWIRSYLIKKKIIQRNVHEEASVDLFSAVYETADEDSFMNKTLIGYHPSGNTS